MMIRMFDADKNGSIGFDEFWYEPLSAAYLNCGGTLTATLTLLTQRALGLPRLLASAVRPLRRRQIRIHLIR